MILSKASRNVSFLFIALILIVIGIAWFGNQTINWAGLVVVLFFYLIIFGIGIWSGQKGDPSDEDNFLLAGRKMPLWIAMITMAATWIGGGFINGTAEAAATSGLVWVQAPWGYGLSLIIGGIFFARKMRRMEYRTMLDPLAERFGKQATGLFFLPAVFGEIFWIAAILTALGTTFSVIIGLDTQTSIIVSALIAILYTVIGGLWSVAYTDIVQLGLIIVGLLLTLPYVVSAVGGMDSLWASYEQNFGEAASLIPDKTAMGDYFWNWLDYALLLIFGGIPWQVYFQRVLAAKNENTAMWLSILAGLICILVAIPAAVIGMAGSVVDWTSLGLPGPETMASILPYTFQHLSPGFVGLIGLGAIAAAVMSSIDSSMLSASTLSVYNVYKPLVKPNLDAAASQKVLQRAIVIIGLTATILSLQVESIYELWFLCSDFVYCLLFPALVSAMFIPHVNRVGALSGFAVAAVLRFGGGDPTLGIPIFIPYPMIEDGIVLFPFRTLAMVSGLLTMVVVSYIVKEPEDL